ncbi:uncharacterized protein [Nicotiana tomentosiformis]|uniref:uncharacterized protein n=1 Tax=Nicotiana tomentosiformis TaxID=4098 RepID=UPI00388CE87B
MGVHLMNSSEGRVIVQNRAKSSLVVEVKEKQYDDPLLGSWDDHLPLIEFAYNNSYHAGIQMALFEALYSRRCISPIGWFEIGEAELIGLDLVHQALEKVKIIKERLKNYPDSSEVLFKFIVPVETIEVNEELTYEEILVSILDRQVRKLRNKEISSVKVLWQNQQVEEATYEAEEEMKKKYPHLFE